MSAQWRPGHLPPEPFDVQAAQAVIALAGEVVPLVESAEPLPVADAEVFAAVGESLARVIEAALSDAELRRVRFAGLDAAIDADVRAAEQAHPFQPPSPDEEP